MGLIHIFFSHDLIILLVASMLINSSSIVASIDKKAVYCIYPTKGKVVIVWIFQVCICFSSKTFEVVNGCIYFVFVEHGWNDSLSKYTFCFCADTFDVN